MAGWRAAAAAQGAAATPPAGSAGGLGSPGADAMAAAGLETLETLGRARQGSAPPAVAARCGSAGDGNPNPCPGVGPRGQAHPAGHQRLAERLGGGTPQGSPPLQGGFRGCGSPHLGASPLGPHLMRMASGTTDGGSPQLYRVSGSPLQTQVLQGGGASAGPPAGASCAPAALWRQASLNPGMTLDPGMGPPGKPGQAMLGRSQSYFSGGGHPGGDAIRAVWPPDTGAGLGLREALATQASSGAEYACEQSPGMPWRGQLASDDPKPNPATAAANALAPRMASLGLGRNPGAHSALALCRDIWGRRAEALER